MVDRHPRMLVATMRITTNTTPKTTTGAKSEYWLNHLVVVIAAGKRPVSIPNLEAKPASADGTAPGRVWESRTPPQQPLKGGARNTRSKSPTTFCIPARQAARGLASRLVKRPQGLPPLSVRTFYYNLHVSTHALLVSEHQAYVRNAVAIESAHAWRVMAPPARNSANTHLMRSLVRSASFPFVVSSRCSSKRSFVLLLGYRGLLGYWA